MRLLATFTATASPQQSFASQDLNNHALANQERKVTTVTMEEDKGATPAMKWLSYLALVIGLPGTIGTIVGAWDASVAVREEARE